MIKSSLKIKYLSYVVFLGTILNAQNNLYSIPVEVTDRYCKAGLDLDSCAYIPLYKSVSHWLGTPYRYAGKSKKGVDCSGFSKAVISEVYSYALRGSSRSIFSACESVQRGQLREGDLVFFKINSKDISHMGVYLQQGFFAHASVSRGVMVNHLDEDYYNRFFYTGARINFKN